MQEDSGQICSFNPTLTVTLTAVQLILDELTDIISGFNTIIDANNAIVTAAPVKRTECTDAVFSVLAFMLKDVITAYRKNNANI